MTSAAATTIDEAFRRVTLGDQQAFAVVYDELAAKVYGVVARVLRDPAMSEEVVQEVFVEVWRTAARFDPAQGSVRAWVLTMARRRAVDRVRREQSQRDRLEEFAAQRGEEGQNPADRVVSSMEVTRVRSALATLPDDQREVIELCFLEGLSHGEIAERLDLPLGTVKGRARGGLKRLRGRVGDG